MNYGDISALLIEIDNVKDKMLLSTFSVGHQTSQLKHFMNIKLFLDDDYDDKLFMRNGWLTKGVEPHYSQQWPLSEILAFANLRHAASTFESAQNLMSGFLNEV